MQLSDIKPGMRYTKTKGSPLLRAMCSQAWEATARAEWTEEKNAAIAEEVKRALSALAPSEHLDVLRIYGATRMVRQFTIEIPNPRNLHRDRTSGVLVEAIEVPAVYAKGHMVELKSGWGDEGAGSGMYSVHVADWIAAEIQTRMEAWAAYADEDMAITLINRRNGRAPTWGQIMEAIPVTGAHMRGLMEQQARTTAERLAA
jgi:hypothetical protein